MKIKNVIEVISFDPVYDIEVTTDDHTFMIGNTRVENCRLLSDTTKLDVFKNEKGNQKDIEVTESAINQLYQEYVRNQEQH